MKTLKRTQAGKPNPDSPRGSRRSKTWTAIARTVLLAFALPNWAGPIVRGADLPGTESQDSDATGLRRVGIGFSGQSWGFDLQVPESRRETLQKRLGKLGTPLFRYLDRIDGRDGEALGGLHVLPEVQTAVLAGLVAWTPIGILAGTVWGAVEGSSEKRISRDEAVLTDVLGKLGEPGSVQKALFILLEGQLPGVVLLTNRLADSSEFRRPGLMDAAAPFPPAYYAAVRTRCDPGTYGDCDVVMNLKVITWGLTGLDQADPSLSLSLLVGATLCSPRNGSRGTTIYANYQGQPLRFSEWSRDGGEALQQELLTALERVADQIAIHVPRPVTGPVLAAHPIR